MGMEIRNNTAKPIWLRLNSGNSISVFPNQAACKIDSNEVDGNLMIKKLAERHAIDINPGEPAAKKSSNSKTPANKNSTKSHAGTKKAEN